MAEIQFNIYYTFYNVVDSFYVNANEHFNKFYSCLRNSWMIKIIKLDLCSYILCKRRFILIFRYGIDMHIAINLKPRLYNEFLFTKAAYINHLRCWKKLDKKVMHIWTNFLKMERWKSTETDYKLITYFPNIDSFHFNKIIHYCSGNCSFIIKNVCL